MLKLIQQVSAIAGHIVSARGLKIEDVDIPSSRKPVAAWDLATVAILRQSISLCYSGLRRRSF